jgi:hypothetical protein
MSLLFADMGLSSKANLKCPRLPSSIKEFPAYKGKIQNFAAQLGLAEVLTLENHPKLLTAAEKTQMEADYAVEADLA